MNVRLEFGDAARTNHRKYAVKLCNTDGLCDMRGYTNEFSDRMSISGSRVTGTAKSFDGKYDFEFWIDDTGRCNFKNKGDDDSEKFLLTKDGEAHYWKKSGILFGWLRFTDTSFSCLLDGA